MIGQISARYRYAISFEPASVMEFGFYHCYVFQRPVCPRSLNERFMRSGSETSIKRYAKETICPTLLARSD